MSQSEHTNYMFNERLKELMEGNDIDIKQLFKLLELKDITNLYSWLRGDTLPSTENLVVLANLFKCSTDYLLGRSDDFAEIYSPIKSFHEQLKFVMNLKSVSQYKMRKEKVATPSNFHKWFKLKSLPTVSSLIRLADYFGVSIDFLLGRE